MTLPLAVVSVGVGAWYGNGIQRMRESLRALPITPGATPLLAMLWEDKYPPGSPTHQEMPYAFKAHAIRHARNQGYELVLWLDAADWFVADPAPLYSYMKNNIGFFMADGWKVGEWCSDDALPILGIDRESAFDMTLLWSNAFGFNFTKPEACEAFAEFERLSKTTAFRGPWDNVDGRASSDPRVKGHRHDQTALSVIVHKLKIPTIPCGRSFVQCRGTANDYAVIHAEGM